MVSARLGAGARGADRLPRPAPRADPRHVQAAVQCAAWRRGTAEGPRHRRCRAVKLQALFLAAVVVLAAPARASDRPNIVFIMADDHAAHAISAYGSRLNKTPNIDRLAQEGMVLRNVLRDQLDLHAEPRVDPDRSVLARQRRAGVQPVRQLAADRRATSPGRRIPHRTDRQVAPRERPGRLRSVGDPAGAGRLHDPVLYTAAGEKTYTGRYATDVITDLAIDFLRVQARRTSHSS